MLYPLLLRRWFQATAILPLTPYLWLWEHSQKRCKTTQEAVKEWPQSVTRACGCAVLGKVKDVPPPLLSSHLGHSRHQSCHWAAASNCCQLPAPQPTTNTRVPHRTLVAYSGLAHIVLGFIPWLQQPHPFPDENPSSSLGPITPVSASRHRGVFCCHSRPFRKR